MATTHPAGTRVGLISGFDRSTKVAFHCPKHPELGAWASKDPWASSWFPASQGAGNPCECPLVDYETIREYTALT